MVLVQYYYHVRVVSLLIREPRPRILEDVRLKCLRGARPSAVRSTVRSFRAVCLFTFASIPRLRLSSLLLSAASFPSSSPATATTTSVTRDRNGVTDDDRAEDSRGDLARGNVVLSMTMTTEAARTVVTPATTMPNFVVFSTTLVDGNRC